jgi:hypothetical protein
VACGWVLACGSDPIAGTDPDGGVTAGADGPPSPGGESFTVTWGPVTIGPSEEDTRCIQKKLGNAGPAWIGNIRTNLQASHHMIVYRVPGDEEMAELYPCSPFFDTVRPASASAPLMVTQIEEEDLGLPAGVAFSVDADQLVRLEVHFINYTDADLTIEASATFDTVPEEQVEHVADFLFTGNLDIELDPGPGSLGPTWFPLPSELADIRMFGMTGHTHQWGTDVEVELRPSRDEPGQMVYDYEDWNWQEPPIARFDPPLTLPAGAGFRFTCRWDNRSGGPVHVGEGANDEMCFFWGYYFPSQGHKVCVHTDQYDDGVDEPGVDLCCPGHPYCSFLDQFL